MSKPKEKMYDYRLKDSKAFFETEEGLMILNDYRYFEEKFKISITPVGHIKIINNSEWDIRVFFDNKRDFSCTKRNTYTHSKEIFKKITIDMMTLEIGNMIDIPHDALRIYFKTIDDKDDITEKIRYLRWKEYVYRPLYTKMMVELSPQNNLPEKTYSEVANFPPLGTKSWADFTDEDDVKPFPNQISKEVNKDKIDKDDILIDIIKFKKEMRRKYKNIEIKLSATIDGDKIYWDKCK